MFHWRACSVKFGKIHKKAPTLESRLFNEVADLQRLTLSKNRLRHKCILVNLAKFLITLWTVASHFSVTVPPRPFVFSTIRKFSAYLVRAKLYPFERRVGSYKCRCIRCQFVAVKQKLTYLYVTATKGLLKSVTALTVKRSVWFIY